MAVLLVAAACTPQTGPSPTITPPVTTSSTMPADEPATTTTAPPTTTTAPSRTEVTTGDVARGTLPDGTHYEVLVEPQVAMPVEDISGAVMLDLADGTSRAVGITGFSSTTTLRQAALRGNRLEVPSGGGLVVIDLDDEVLAMLGPGAEQMLLQRIRPVAGARLPALELDPPFRWAGDDEIPLQMGVLHGLFEVRRGCDDDLAVTCSQTRGVQVIPAHRLYGGSSVADWPDDLQIWVAATAARPTTDPFYLDPGPLSPRFGASVLWTGEEMIVWGGGGNTHGRPELVDGAAFDPLEDRWRMLPPSPLSPGQPTRAVWARDRMIVVGSRATAEYVPAVDQWRVIAAGIEPPPSERLLRWAGDRLALWNDQGLHRLDRAAGAWVPMDGPGFGNADPWATALLEIDDWLAVAALRNGNCTGRQIALQSDAGWEGLPPVSLDTPSHADCSYPHQMAWVGERLLAWEAQDHPTMALDMDSREWSQIATITLQSHESPDGPVPMGDRLLVPRYGSGAVYDANTGFWEPVALPGDGTAPTMVWTGTELLMWGAPCCSGASEEFTVDAWRWRPP